MDMYNAEYVLKIVEDYIERIEKEGNTNEQWFIEFEIELSKLATKDHNGH